MFFACLLLCIHACMVQSVLGQCIRPYATGLAPAAELASPLSCNGALAMISAPFAASVTAPFTEPFLVAAAADHYGAYGGAGLAEVAGDISAFGSGLVAGQVPIGGLVRAGPGLLAGPLAAGPVGAYGGAGIGEVAVAGELPVGGTTLVAGQVPILGAVQFGGPVCAGGTVSVAGSCACGCAASYML